MEIVSERERRTAAAMHVGSVFAPFVVPGVVWVATRSSSPFVARHAWRALMEAIVWKLLFVIGAAASLSYTAYRLYGYYLNDWQGLNVWEFVIRMAVAWTIVTLLGVWNIVQGLRQAHRAYRGIPATRSTTG